ncbi:MAG: hypothetical protein C4576_28940 [Desulfobacteraceae bacterium]|nr:MAG: hypothetical protein C4576_28940 [Desulfobacteraceae bacterium]
MPEIHGEYPIMNRIFGDRMLFLFTGASALVFAWLHLAVAQASHHHLPAPSPPVSAPPPVIRPPTPVPVIPSRPVAPPPTFQKGGPTPEQKAEMDRLQRQISEVEKAIEQRKGEIALLEEEIEDKEYVIRTLDERIAIFSDEKTAILAERNDIRNSLESYRLELIDNEFFMKVGINLRTSAVPGYPVTVGLIDWWVGSGTFNCLDKQIEYMPKLIQEYQKIIDSDPPKVTYWINQVYATIEHFRNLSDSPQADREYYSGLVQRLESEAPAKIRKIREQYAYLYEDKRVIYEKKIQEARERLSDCMAAKDRLLSMRPTVLGAEDRIKQIELRAVELDRLIADDVSHRNGIRGLDTARIQKEQFERGLASFIERKNSLARSLDKLSGSTGSGAQTAAAVEPVEPPPPEKKVGPDGVEKKETKPLPERAEDKPKPPPEIKVGGGVEDGSEKRARLQQDMEYHLRNRDRAQAELRSIEKRSGTEKQQADLRARIAASEEFALAATRELTRLGGQASDYVREDLSDYDPYKLTPTDLKLMDLSARSRAENDATEQLIKTRQFIFNTTDTADAMDLIQKLDRIAGYNNQGGLRDFERLDAVREFRATVYETRIQASFSQEILEATLADIDNAAYEIAAGRVKTGSTLVLALGTGALGMTAMAGQAGLATVSAGTGALLTTQAAAASKVLLVYNISTGSISGYSENGVKGAMEGGGKEVLPINTYIAIRDGKGGGSIAVGLYQDAGNVLQIFTFAKTLKTATQRSAAANVESTLDGPDAELNRVWKLDQAQADFLSTQMSAQATVANTGMEDPAKKPMGDTPARGRSGSSGTGTSSGSASVGMIPMGGSWDTQKTTSQFKAGEGIAGLEKLGMSNATVQSSLPAGLSTGASMSEVQAAGRELIKNFDTGVLPALNKLNQGRVVASDTALGLTPELERQVEIIRGMAEGQYSPIVADKLMLQETGQSLAEGMARLSGTVEFVQKL